MVDNKNHYQITGFKFPLIVKPTDRSGSRGVEKVLVPVQLEEAISRARKESFEHKAIIEEFVTGREISVEAISNEGQHTILQITDKVTTGAPFFVELEHHQPSSLPENIKDRVRRVVLKALDALHVKNGASHAEFKIDEDGNIGIIEIGARMGGDCIGSDLVKISTGNNFVRMVIDVALGKKPTFAKNYKQKVAVIKFVFSKDDYKKLEAISKKYKENLYYKSEMEDMDHEIVDSSSRYGFYIFAFKDKDEYNKYFKGVL